MATAREDLFGTDLRLFPAGDSTAIGADPRLDLRRSELGDLALARGNENIAQALLLRLKVRRGELAPLGWPDYGSRIHELLGEPNNARTRVKLNAFARAAVEEDPRVRRVKDVSAEPGERDTVRLLLEIELIETRNPLNLVFDLRLEAP